MAITSLKGRLGFKLQSNCLPQYSKDGSPSAAPISYYPADGTVLSHRATSVNFGPQMDQRQLGQEIGGGIFPTGAYRTSYSGSGDFSVQPRLEGVLGWLMYMFTGEILGECTKAVGTTNVVEHNFVMPQGADAGYTPWVTLFKYLPGLGSGSDAVEVLEDGRVVGCNINIPAAGLPTMDFTARARLWGLTGEEQFVDRSVLVGLDTSGLGSAVSGTTLTLVDAALTFSGVNSEQGKHVYIAGNVNQWAVVASNTTDTLTFTEELRTAVTTDPYIIGTEAEGGTIKTVLSSSMTPAEHVNAFINVEGKGTRRVKWNDATTMKLDGELWEEAADGDWFVVIPALSPTGAGTTATVVSTALFGDETYLDYYIQVWDADGNNLGFGKITEIDTNTATVDTTFAAATAATDTIVLFGPMTAVTWGGYEDPSSIPVTSVPSGYFKGLKAPFDGDALPVRQVRVNVQYQTLSPEQEMIIGAYEMDGVTVQGINVELSYTYRIKDYALYSSIMSGAGVTALMNRFSASVFKSDVAIRIATPGNIPGTEIPYSMEIMLPDVVWEMSGPPRLSMGDVIELDFTGRVNVIEGDLTVLAEKTIASAGDVNAVTGAISHAGLDATALAAAGLDGDDFVGLFVRITSGTGAGQVRGILTYVDGTSEGTITPHRPWLTTPDNTSKFVIERRFALFQVVNNTAAYAASVPLTP